MKEHLEHQGVKLVDEEADVWWRVGSQRPRDRSTITMSTILVGMMRWIVSSWLSAVLIIWELLCAFVSSEESAGAILHRL